MCTLRNLSHTCGEALPPGTKTKLYLIPVAEITAFPDVVGTSAAGDSKFTSENFTLVTTTGLGYFRAIDIWVDTGVIRNTLEGELGGQGFRQRVDFFVIGNDKEQLEFADSMLCNSGCLLSVIIDKVGNYHIIGTKEDPVYLEAAEGGTGGDRVGFQYTLYANTGKTTIIHDAATYPLDLTPAA